MMNRKNIYISALVGIGLAGMSLFAVSAYSENADEIKAEKWYEATDMDDAKNKQKNKHKVKGNQKVKSNNKLKTKHLHHVDKQMGMAKSRKVEKVYDEVMNDPGNFFKSPTYIVNKNGKTITLSGENNSVDEIYNK